MCAVVSVGGKEGAGLLIGDQLGHERPSGARQTIDILPRADGAELGRYKLVPTSAGDDT
jgi:hypothetical protein